MTQRKRSEGEFSTMMRSYEYWVHKWRDRGYPECPHCHRMITRCPHCHQDTLLPKAQTYPDYTFAKKVGLCEVKDGKERFSWKQDISDNQYRVMTTEEDAWLFLEMGEGRAPNGRQAFFVPWRAWIDYEKQLEARGVLSIVYEQAPRSRNPSAREILIQYECIWMNGQWTLPADHPFWKMHEGSNHDTDARINTVATQGELDFNP